MTRDQIIRLAREAGFVLSDSATDEAIDRFRRFATLIATAEREACAEEAEQAASDANKYDIADAIRYRGQS